MHSRRFVMVLALAGLAATADAAAPPASRRTNRCYGIRVEAVQAPDAPARRRRFRRRFSAGEVLDLRLNVILHAKNSAGLVEIKLYTPQGRLYDILEARAQGETKVLRGRFRRRRRVVSADFPIAGSHITSRSLYGKWRAEVFLNGSDRRCGPKKTFVIRP